MLNQPLLGELIRESMNNVGWNATETAERLGCQQRGGFWGMTARDLCGVPREGGTDRRDNQLALTIRDVRQGVSN